jgi:uncharacterized protein YkwD
MLKGLVAAALSLVMAATPVLASNTEIYGDADCDGILSASDAACILSYVLNSRYEIEDFSVKKLDVDNDGMITSNDAACILSKVLNGKYTMPIENVTSGGAVETVTSDSSLSTTINQSETQTTTETTTKATTETTTEATTKTTTETTTETTTKTTTETTTETTTVTTTTEATTETTTLSAEVSVKVKVGTFGIGEAESDLPTADSVGTTPEGTKWYSYNADYKHYTKVGVCNGVVARIVTFDVDAVYDGHTIGDTVDYTTDPDDSYEIIDPQEELTRNVKYELYFDTNDSNRVYAIALTSRKYAAKMSSGTEESVSELEKQIMDLTNAFRAQLGIYDLVWNETLAGVARKHAVDMMENSYFAHNSQDGTTFKERIKKVLSGKYYAENIAAGQTTAEQTVNDWVNSKHGHRQFLVSTEVEHIGVGFVYDENDTQGYYSRIVQDFYTPNS